MLRFIVCCIPLLVAQFAAAQESYTLDEKTDTWVLTNAPEPGSPEAQLAVAAKELAEGDYHEAIKLSSIWMVRHKRHPLLGEAHIIHGDALFEQRYFYESLFDYEIVARDFYGTQAEIIANERELQIATMFAHGLKRLNFGFRMSDATDEAEELFIRIQERLPDSPLAETAALELADLYYRKQKMKLANDMYQIFIENFPTSPFIERARARLIYTRLATYRGPAFNSVGLDDARKELVQLQYISPRLATAVNSDGLITRIDESLSQKMLHTAKWYLRVNNPIAAEYTVRRLLETHENTTAAIEAMEDLVPNIMPQLPPVILSEIGDFYDIYREHILGSTQTFIDTIESNP
ncbi:MAG: outer membrane protein assembly factor BamD [Phycisphaerae bacterium]|nr:outer membrane protein assembly factor BamD [Phycisphaerae bacterium]